MRRTTAATKCGARTEHLARVNTPTFIFSINRPPRTLLHPCGGGELLLSCTSCSETKKEQKNEKKVLISFEKGFWTLLRELGASARLAGLVLVSPSITLIPTTGYVKPRPFSWKMVRWMGQRPSLRTPVLLVASPKFPPILHNR